MSLETDMIEITADNIVEHPQAICFINPKHEFYHKKIAWLDNQFKNGLKIKLLYFKGEKRPVGFIEYIPGDYCWRAISARGYMFIHCLWTTGKKFQRQGLGSLLIEEVDKVAENMLGVAAIVSDRSFMANKEIFLKNGFKILAESGDEQLMVKQFRDGPLPSLNNWQGELAKYKYIGLTIVYSNQCPWVARFIEEVKPILDEEKIKPKISELKNASQAQRAPSLYGVFNLIYNGRLLADRYISTTRFLNIIRKEIKKS